MCSSKEDQEEKRQEEEIERLEVRVLYMCVCRN